MTRGPVLDVKLVARLADGDQKALGEIAKLLRKTAKDKKRADRRAAEKRLMQQVPLLSDVKKLSGGSFLHKKLVESILEFVRNEHARANGRTAEGGDTAAGGPTSFNAGRGDTYTPKTDCCGNPIAPERIPGPSGLY